MRPINRIKHVVDLSGTVTAASQLDESLINAVDAPVLSVAKQVQTGATVNGIYLRVEVVPNETDPGAIPNVYLGIFKNVGGGLSVPALNAVGTDDLKRYMIHQEMVMLNNVAGGNPRVIFNGVIAIPKGYRRFGPGDKLNISVLSTAINFAYCLQCHYKEFR